MGRPKPLLEYRSESFLGRQIRLCQSRGLAVYVVLGRDAEMIAACCPAAAGAALLLNPDPARGMLSSLQIGLAALPSATPAVLFTPVDNPGVRETTLDAILETWRRLRPPVVIPRLRGERRGHPVLIDGSLIAPLLAWPADSTPRDFVHSRIENAAWVDVEDPNVVADIDTPADYEAMLSAEEAP